MSDITALVITSAGDVKTVTFPKGRMQEAFREHCGAQYFDKLSVSGDVDIWLDDEGLLVSEPDVNIFVTAIRDFLWRQDPRIDPDGVANYPPAAGTAMFTGGADANGNMLSLSPRYVTLFTRHVERLREFLANGL